MSDNEFDALGYLQAVYRGQIVAESARMKAAGMALPFERPKLAVVQNVHSFAEQMRSIARQQRPGGNVIDHRPASDFQKVEVLKEKD